MTEIIIATESQQLHEPLVGEFTPVAWCAPDDLSWDDWLQVGEALSLATGAIHFWIGDWILAGECRWGEKYAQAVDATHFVIGTLQNDAWVASRVPPSLRNEKLSWTHHYLVADTRYDEDTQRALLSKAAERGWTTRYMRKVIENWWCIFGGESRKRTASRSRDDAVSALPLASSPTIPTYIDPPSRIDWKNAARRFARLKRHWERRAIKAEEELAQVKRELRELQDDFAVELDKEWLLPSYSNDDYYGVNVE